MKNAIAQPPAMELASEFNPESMALTNAIRTLPAAKMVSSDAAMNVKTTLRDRFPTSRLEHGNSRVVPVSDIVIVV
jgi:hypothetical protein